MKAPKCSVGKESEGFKALSVRLSLSEVGVQLEDQHKERVIIADCAQTCWEFVRCFRHEHVIWQAS